MKVGLVGGHLSPALAVIDALDKDTEVVFFGRKYALEGENAQSLEYQEITKRNIPFYPLTTARLQRSITRHTVPTLAKLPIGLYQAVTYLRKEQPDVVLSFGGYLSVPIGYAAKFLGIPLVIHEQTLHAGLANKLLGNIADRICISWEQSKKYFPKKKTVMTGNPLKKFSESDIPLPFLKEDEKLPLIYITGGSTGSHAINTLIEECLSELLSFSRVLHQVGDARAYNDYERLSEQRDQLPLELQRRYRIEKFVAPGQVKSILSSSKLVVSRSGINTVTELIYFGRPSLLIPLPYGQKNEQLENARFLASLGLAQILPQHTASGEKMIQIIKEMIDNYKSYTSHVKDAQSHLHLNAAEEIVTTLSYVVKKKTS